MHSLPRLPSLPGEGREVEATPTATKMEKDSDSDSDFAPDANEDNEEEDVVEKDSGLGGGIKGFKRDKINSLWDEMNSADQVELAAKSAAKAGAGKGKKAKKKKLVSKKAGKVLEGIFGKGAAKSLVAKASASKARADEMGPVGAFKAPKQVEITEVKKFAGREIAVTRKVVEGSAEEAAAKAKESKKKQGGLDGVLAAMNAPKAISTVDKSSMDWDKFKQEEGLEGELALVTKGGGYLNKQDFLLRCDNRQFEQERDARQAARKG
ncbi:unnamed protein product [Chrysoparadoxa australica]